MDVNTNTVRNLINFGIKRLSDVDDPELESRILLFSVFGWTEKDYVLRPERSIPRTQIDRYLHLLDQRRQGTPLAYLTGEKEFWSLTFKVEPGVLIPRPETELIIEQVLAHSYGDPAKILDLGTGSGNIAISLALELPDSLITATDISPAALKIAHGNARRHGAKIQFLHGDRFDPFKNSKPTPRFDFIVSNPPYVSLEEWKGLDPEIRDHEPREALIGGKMGTEFIRDLIQQAPDFLVAGGRLILEIGYGQESSIRPFFNEPWGAVTCLPDLAGIPRIFSAQRISSRDVLSG
jgi:release factor glutamine methyltransferase